MTGIWRCRSALTLSLAAVLVAVSTAAAVVGGSAPARGATAAYVPAQFIAKQYTEALGRLPDQPGWQSTVTYFTQNGCTAGTLATFGEAVFNSPEYAGLGYDNDARVLTLYRAALNREPDASGLSNWVGQLHSGMSWATVVQKFYTSSDFTALVPQICSGVVDGSGSSYYFGTYPAIALPTDPTSDETVPSDEASLQNQINTLHQNGGGTIKLAPRTLVWLTKPLVVPAGVTLTTGGSLEAPVTPPSTIGAPPDRTVGPSPDTRHYAEMARLVRSSSFAAPPSKIGMVQVQAGAGLTSVWVDGARDTPGNFSLLEDVMTYGGPGTTLSDNRIDNAQGPNTVYLLGGYDGYTCPSETVSGNLITAYSSDHYQPGNGSGEFTDGIADNCEDATISGNQVVDASDVAIVVYRNTPDSAQHSVVTGNTVLSAGNSMYGGLGFDPLTHDPVQTLSFSGASIDHNTMWTGPDTHFDIGITDGSRAWFAGTYPTNQGTGASVTANTTGTLSARVQIGVGVNGMSYSTVSGNTMTFSHISAGSCPKADYAAEISAGYADHGTFSPTPVDVNFDGCV